MGAAVWAVWRCDRTHRVRLANRASAERWVLAHDPELWEIVPVDDDTASEAEADTEQATLDD